MKQPNWKTPLILSASLLVVGTFAYWLQYSHKPKKEKGDIATKKPISLPAEDTQVAMIKIKSSTGLIELTCESIAEKKCTGSTLGKWKITHPKAPNGEPYPADASSVKEFLNNAETAIATEVIDLKEETPEKRKSLLADYGLSDELRASINMQFLELVSADAQGKPGKRYTAWYGVEHPLGDKTFVASSVDGVISDQAVFLLSNQNKTGNFTKTVTNFRDKTLFTFDRKDITEFTAKVTKEVKNGGKLVAKKENGLWTINGFQAKFDHIETILSAIANAKATEFVDQSLIKGLKPAITYDLKAGEKSYSLSLYEKNLAAKKIGNDKLPAEKHYYLQSSEKKELVEVDAILRNNIDKGLVDLRNTSLLTDTEKVTATQFKVVSSSYKAQPEFTLVKGNWVPKDPSQNYEVALVQKLIDIFAITKIKDFVSPAPAGKELYKVSIGDEKNPNKFHYSIFSIKDTFYAKDLNSKTNEAFLLEDSMKLALPKLESEWKIKAAEPK